MRRPDRATTARPALPGHIDVMQVSASLAPRDGGPSTGITALNAAFREQGVSAIVVTTDADGAHGRLSDDAAGLVERDGALVFFGRRSRPHRLKHSWQQARMIWRLAPCTGVIHIHGIYLSHSICAFLAAKRFGVPYVIQPHGTLEPYQEQEGRWRKGLFNALGGRAILSGARFLVAASTAEAKNLAERLPSVPARVFPLGVSLPSPQVPSALTPEQLDTLQSVPRARRVAFVGRLAKKKRPDLVVDTWQQLDADGALLIIAGPAEDWTHDQLRQRLSPDKAERVIWLEQLNRPEVAWVLSQTGIFVLPSENENFGIAVAEAMASGCAVISTESTAATEHVSIAGSGEILQQPELPQLRDVVSQLMASTDQSHYMGMRGLDYAQSTLTWAALATSLLKAYATRPLQHTGDNK